MAPSSLSSLAQGSRGRAPIEKALPAVASSSLRSASPTRRPCCRRAAAPCPWRPYCVSPCVQRSPPCLRAAAQCRCAHLHACVLLRSAVGACLVLGKMRSKPRTAAAPSLALRRRHASLLHISHGKQQPLRVTRSTRCARPRGVAVGQQ
ncbi:hypothetical protein ZEAMMB73_Zm00001d036102 [Zea mays]|uniref:Uncharacterized protein n=1 Tax=Zea mays TaxID=4577 RepID=A0A1D6LKQ8_MAIZE|nr:hypothetical protein ZEAMMB73_Zm00001d036102 [Zea mays]